MRRTTAITATLLAVLALAGAAWLYVPQGGGDSATLPCSPPPCAGRSSASPSVVLKTPPPHDQGRTPLCWLAAMLTTLETDRLNMGDSLRLSLAWPVRHSLMEQGRRACLLAAHGADAAVTLRGTLPEAFRLLQEYGAVPEDSYRMTEDVVTGAVAHIARVFGRHGRGLDALSRALDRELDRQLGPAPLRVYMLGMEYTPGEFIRSIALPGDWRAYTSFTHHPYHTTFAPELPDNPQRHEAYNVTPQELQDIVTRSLWHGHPVAWEGCMRGIVTGDVTGGEVTGGVGILAYDDKKRRQECLRPQSQRQRLFERGRLTDDHCLTIVGCDAHGLLCLNSWGERDKWVSMTWRQFLLNTIMIMARQ